MEAKKIARKNIFGTKKKDPRDKLTENNNNDTELVVRAKI